MADRVKKKPAPLSSNAIQLRISGSMLGYQMMENGRMFRELEHGTLYIDFLTEHPPRQSGTREVSGISAEVCPGINRALAVRKYVSIQGIDKYGEPKTYRVPICGIGPLLVLKLNAFAKRSGGKRAKDAYDLLVAVSSYHDVERAAAAIAGVIERTIA
jgi:hypothetical protein